MNKKPDDNNVKKTQFIEEIRKKIPTYELMNGIQKSKFQVILSGYYDLGANISRLTKKLGYKSRESIFSYLKSIEIEPKQLKEAYEKIIFSQED